MLYSILRHVLCFEASALAWIQTFCFAPHTARCLCTETRKLALHMIARQNSVCSQGSKKLLERNAVLHLSGFIVDDVLEVAALICCKLGFCLLNVLSLHQAIDCRRKEGSAQALMR